MGRREGGKEGEWGGREGEMKGEWGGREGVGREGGCVGREEGRVR